MGLGCELYRGVLSVGGHSEPGPGVRSSGVGEELLGAARGAAAVGDGLHGGGRWAPRGVGAAPCGAARSLRGGAEPSRAVPGVGGAALGPVPPLRLRSDRSVTSRSPRERRGRSGAAPNCELPALNDGLKLIPLPGVRGGIAGVEPLRMFTMELKLVIPRRSSRCCARCHRIAPGPPVLSSTLRPRCRFSPLYLTA